MCCWLKLSGKTGAAKCMVRALFWFIVILVVCASERVFFAAEVVEIVGSPGLKESFEAHLSDVLNDVPADKDDTDVPISEYCNQVHKDATEGNGTAVEEHVASDATELDVPAVGADMVLPPPPSSLAPSSVTMAVEDSQDSILDIEGFTDDEEVSLMGWNADDAGGVENGNSAAKISIAYVTPKHNNVINNLTKQHDCGGSWRTLVHRDDPFLCLVPCEIAQVVAALQDHQYNHLETYRQLGFRVSGS